MMSSSGFLGDDWTGRELLSPTPRACIHQHITAELNNQTSITTQSTKTEATSCYKSSFLGLELGPIYL